MLNLKSAVENIKIAFLINYRIRRKKKVIKQIEQHFHDWATIKIVESKRYQHFVDLPQELIDDGYTHLIAVGGDGTLHEIINGVAKFFEREPGEISEEMRNVRVGILPYGTGNDFAKTLGITRSVSELADLIKTGRSKVIDFGHTNLTDANGSKKDCYFINILDAGMGGVIAKKMNERGFSGSYGLNVLKTFFTYKPLCVKCKSASFQWEGKVISMVLANGKYFGNGIGIAPHANVESGDLAITACGELSMFAYLMQLPTLKKCVKVDHPEITYGSEKEVQILGPEGAVPIEADGEFLGYTPATVKTISKRLNFIY